MLNPQKQGHFLNNQDFNLPAGAVSINNCDKEPIHIPGSIQPHGYLLAFSDEGVVQYVSKNLQNLNNKSVEDCIGKPLKEVIGEDQVAEVWKVAGSVIQKNSVEQKKFFHLEISNPEGEAVLFDTILHRNQEAFILELEPAPKNNSLVVDLEYFNESLKQLQTAASPDELAEIIVRKYREITGFNRIMAYRFKEDGSGVVIAEEKDEKLEPFLGLHYPASDIPKQARNLYLLNPIRIIPDVNYVPVEIFPSSGVNSGSQSLDLSLAGLRSVSPIHIQYLKNMGVGASMSVSIVRDQKLWGLFSFHHTKPLKLDYQSRQLCLLLARAFSLVLGEKEEAVRKDYRNKVQEVQNALLQQMTLSSKFTEGLFKHQITVRDLIDCGGCALLLGGDYISLGEVPSEQQVKQLAEWLQKNMKDTLYHTNHLSEDYPPAESFRHLGSGILAMSISKVQQEFIIWFRPEQVRTVQWAGMPEKEKKEVGGEVQLHPRTSFKAWSEQVRNTSVAWSSLEVEAAASLRSTILDLVLRVSGELKLRADILSRINQEINTEKNELDSFAYIASHDLKEPLRGIHQYAAFLLEDYGKQLDEQGQAKLQTLMRLSKRMEQLVNSLLQFSRMGRMDLKLEKVSLKKVIDEVVEIFSHRLVEENVELEIQAEWPVVNCDSLLLSQVFTNLISNAIKYNDKEKKQISVGHRKAGDHEISPSGIICFVKDNGIGIDPKFEGEVFNIFRRLHARDAFGGGTGAGLTISKKIVERHEGQIWVESQPGKGSTFYFSC